ncbi:hypothetical protein CCR96_19660 [Halochromatium roseum]|nr:hypothetical protein [Halochromatium roseum]
MMTRELMILAPSAEAAAEIVRRMHPEATVETIEDTGRATASDVIHFHQHAKATNKRANRGKAA